jgi:hypothetical protein
VTAIVGSATEITTQQLETTELSRLQIPFDDTEV